MFCLYHIFLQQKMAHVNTCLLQLLRHSCSKEYQCFRFLKKLKILWKHPVSNMSGAFPQLNII